VSPPDGTTRWSTLTLALSLAHSFALTGAGASVSPQNWREKGEAAFVSAIR